MNKLTLYTFLFAIICSSFSSVLLFGINLSIYDLILIICFGLVLIQKSLVFYGTIKFRLHISNFLIFILLIGATISAFNSSSLINSLIILAQYLFAIIIQKVIIDYLFSCSKQPSKTLMKILDFFVLSFSLTMIIGVLAYFNVMPNSSSFFSGNGRLYSLKGNPNSLAKYIVYCLPILLIYIELKRKSLMITLVSISAIFSLLLTASFGGIIYGIFTLFYFLFLKLVFITKPISFNKGNILLKQNSLNVRALFAALVLIGVTIFILINPPEVLKSRVLSADDLDDAGSATVKIELMRESLDYTTSNFAIVGMGLGEYPNYSAFDTNVHNLYLLIFSEAGILGFVGLIGLLIYIFVKSFQVINVTQNQKSKIALIGLNSSMFAFLISITTNTHTYSREVWLIVILLWSYLDFLNKKNTVK